MWAAEPNVVEVANDSRTEGTVSVRLKLRLEEPLRSSCSGTQDVFQRAELIGCSSSSEAVIYFAEDGLELLAAVPVA